MGEERIKLSDNTTLPKIELKTKGIRTEVIIDGQRLEKIRKVSFTHEAGELPVLSVDFAAADLYLDAEMLPGLPEPFQPFYEHKTTKAKGTPAPESESPANEAMITIRPGAISDALNHLSQDSVPPPGSRFGKQ